MDIRDQQLRRMAYNWDQHTQESSQPTTKLSDEVLEPADGDDGTTSLEPHHFITISQKNSFHIGSWLQKHSGDPATKDFLPHLKDHLLAWLDGVSHSGDNYVYSQEEHAQLAFRNDRMYQHQTFHVNYTTYDVQRDQDMVKSTGPWRNIMLHAESTGDPLSGFANNFWYARIVGIFHVNVLNLRCQNSRPEWMEFLFVCWMGQEPGWVSGWKSMCLERIGFVHGSDVNTFGFVDPFYVVRASHLIPAFVNGHTGRLLGQSRLSRGATERNDWDTYYVNIFVDRDMTMRYVGGGVGHHTELSPSAYPTIGTEEAEDNDNKENNGSDGELDMDADEDEDNDILGFGAFRNKQWKSDPVVKTGGFLLHTIEMFTLPSVIITQGLAHSADLDDCSAYTDDENQIWDAYESLLEIDTSIYGHLGSANGIKEVSTLLQTCASAVKSIDTKGVKDGIPGWHLQLYPDSPGIPQHKRSKQRSVLARLHLTEAQPMVPTGRTSFIKVHDPVTPWIGLLQGPLLVK
ncbi:hypothetical protein DXG01_007397, partial [Tephrocybe rancida]